MTEQEWEDERRRLVFEALGAASVCWEDLHKAGQFDSGQATVVGEKLLRDLELLYAPPQRWS